MTTRIDRRRSSAETPGKLVSGTESTDYDLLMPRPENAT